MTVIKSEQLICVDVDDSLLLWNSPARLSASKDAVDFSNPYTGMRHRVAVHMPHVLVVRQRLQRGATIVLWSASGWQWAEAAAIACNINGENLIIASKPSFYIDDKSAENWMGKPMYMDPDDLWAR